MKKILLLTGVLLALTASAALAQPFSLDMAWNNCRTNPTGWAIDISDPCTSNSGSYPFYMSFIAPAGISKLTSEKFLLDVQTNQATLPDWWHLETGGCRPTGFSFSTTPGVDQTNCFDYWGTTPRGGTVNWYPGTGGPGRSRLIGIYSVSAGLAAPLYDPYPYYVGSAAIYKVKTVNAALPPPGVIACAGCAFPANLCFNYLLLQQPAGTPNGDMSTELAHISRVITWQGGIDPLATATRRATWGQVKSMYR